MITDWQRFAKDHPRAVNATVVLAVFALSVVGSEWSSSKPSGERVEWWPAALLEGVACAALWWRRSHPRTVVSVTAACVNTGTLAGYLITPLLLGPVMIALYWLAIRTSRATARIGLFGVSALVVPTAVLADHYDHPLFFRTVGPVFWLLVPVAWGTTARLRGAYLEAVHARAEHAERTRDEEARHRVAEERMRIARDLHDVVAHHLALANALAGTAAHLARSHPDQTRRILGDLADTTSSALRELKATVGLLRQADDPDASLEPSPGLGRLSELTAAFASTGLDVAVAVEGEARPLAPSVDLTAFRIVQEALTNVTKHAAVKEARVLVSYSKDKVRITIDDDGSKAPAPPAPGSGFGVIGMRERASSVCGRLQTYRRPEGGFTVATELPLHP
ncbi:sensor histidine kinase [Streptomyces mirabilis]|uniref:sensor histidine kinase n=1 Tax=Streptomyces mirabilis TaxID=68239 RepID=UPI003660EC7A